MPKIRTVGDIKSKLLHPALTSNFEVKIPKPTDVEKKFDEFLTDNGYLDNSVLRDQLNLMCSEAILPGSNLATLELSSNYAGVTERHAYRRIYDNNIDFTFYVDANNYLPIKYFEIWMKFIVDESIAKQTDKDVGSKDSNYFYRVRYPKEYMCEQGLEVTKFERTGNGKSYTGSTLIYKFVNAFPISVFSMPVSYESSSLLKCTVSFSYIRYYIDFKGFTTEKPEKNINSTPIEQAHWNDPGFGEFGVQGQGPQGIFNREYYNNFGNSAEDATNTKNFFNGRNVDRGVFGASGFA